MSAQESGKAQTEAQGQAPALGGLSPQAEGQRLVVERLEGEVADIKMAMEYLQEALSCILSTPGAAEARSHIRWAIQALQRLQLWRERALDRAWVRLQEVESEA